MMATSRLIFRLPPTILLTWGALLLYLAGSGHLPLLLNPLFWPLEIGSGLGLAFLGSAYFLVFRPPSEAGSFSIGRRSLWQAAALLLPFSIAVLNLPASLSASALQARSALSGGRLLANLSSPAKISAAASPSLVDLATAAYYPQHISSVTGKTVHYLGQYLPGDSPGEYRFCRVLISCCAADATPVYLHLIGPQPSVSAMDWIDIKGETFFRKDDGDWTPCVRLTSATKAAAPPDPYLYAVRMSKSSP
jgi:hypothetical protein